MSFDLATSIQNYLTTGKVEGLPNALFMEGQSVAAESRQMMPTWDPGEGRVFLNSPQVKRRMSTVPFRLHKKH
jgi:hypothetical protein